MKFAVAFVACLVLGACDRVPELDTATIDIILIDARLLLRDAPIGRVERSVWPESFAAISPKSVRATKEGLYIATYSFFVEESGFFVARDLAEFAWKERGDPWFVQIRDELFEYRITG
jgi:hypothetical protein